MELPASRSVVEDEPDLMHWLFMAHLPGWGRGPLRAD